MLIRIAIVDVPNPADLGVPAVVVMTMITTEPRVVIVIVSVVAAGARSIPDRTAGAVAADRAHREAGAIAIIPGEVADREAGAIAVIPGEVAAHAAGAEVTAHAAGAAVATNKRKRTPKSVCSKLQGIVRGIWRILTCSVT